ncbi:hypothetical protein RJ640_010067 [Escallonia rubra]|uniref:RING-type domain-containing protein n=1 Tax=Escallonia rubra TaxID=112253 RepID=A0AA88UMM9_9ASTE|nr:hypothetical protein RJ640_010067 [Escallonia rubra]
MDSAAKLPKYHLEPSYHYHNFSRTILPRHSRNYFGRQYSRRNSAYHGDTSTSHGKSTPSREEKLSSKFTGQCSTESRRHTGTETREKASRRPERIRSSPSPVNTVSADVVKMVCGICQKQLKRKPHFLGNTISSSDISVVAVLVCGHNYHADCLEQKTSHEDRRDPPCPLCVGLLSAAAHASRGQD